ncbi:MAG TPA: DUF2505 family protein [Kofleriaceae bacterium]|nr:DUF2505 family protein [Kofleriaceae bacterium]
MKFAIEHVFPEITCAAYEQLYFDEAFNVALGRALDMGRELRRLDITPDRIVRHVCFEPRRDPDPAHPTNRAFGSSRASFVEELDYDVGTRRGAWRTIPNVFTERVRNTGTIELAPAGSGVRRTVRGEVKVSLFGFGGIVERMIVAEIEKSYARSTKFTLDWLARAR